jgi:hypothetical protein
VKAAAPYPVETSLRKARQIALSDGKVGLIDGRQLTPFGRQATWMGVLRDRSAVRRGVAGPRFLGAASGLLLVGIALIVGALGGFEAIEKRLAFFRAGIAAGVANASDAESAHAKLHRLAMPARRWDLNGCAPEMARVDGFCIDRFEASLIEVNLSKFEIPHPASEQLKPGVRYEARSTAGAFPQAYINREQAADACKNAGKRLCSVSEWYEACRGSRQLQYSYAREFVKGKCNTGKLHLLGMMYGNDAESWSYEDFNNPQLNLVPGFLSRAGEYAECRSDYGTYDMVGNLHEWVSDTVDPTLETKLLMVDGVRRSIANNLGKGVFMGGFYSTTNQQGQGCGYITLGHEPQYHDYSTGFRCCSEPNASGTSKPQAR